MVVTRERELEGSGRILFKGTNLQRIVNKPWRPNAQHSEYRPQYCIIITELAKRLDLIIPTTEKKGRLCYMIEMLASTTMSIILQCISVLN